MLTPLFLTINEWITGATYLAALGCFLWGMVSVLLSPCHLASIPLIIAYVGGQKKLLNPRQAAGYAALFTGGLFVTIAVIGIVCALLGRMLGDVGSYWQIVVGLVLVWVALGMLGVKRCDLSGSRLHRLNFKGYPGALFLGLAYGGLSGSCTFGFIAPILAIITVQQQVLTGVMLILMFALGHCLPIMVAGSSTVLVRRLTESETWLGSGAWFRKGAGLVIGILGIYFIGSPFLIG
jgi:cytochrome c-type biogenesis protein